MSTANHIPALLAPADFNKPVRQVDIADPHDFRALADLIGCRWIEYVRTPIEGVWMVIDEEGLYADGAQVNRRVSGILHPGRIVGDVLITGTMQTDEGPDIGPLTPHQRWALEVRGITPAREEVSA